MVYRTEMMKDVIARRSMPDDPWDAGASADEQLQRYLRGQAQQWIQQAHERGQNDLHIQQD